MKILIIAAHPDDEVLGCGGTIARLVNEGKDVYVAILGEGITSRYSQRDKANKADLEALRDCSRNVSDFLGVKKLFQYNFPDNRFDSVPILDIIKTIEKLISDLKPEILYTHHGGDLNIDHSIVHKATVTATRPVPKQTVHEIYAYEVPSSTEWAFGKCYDFFQPNVFVDISPNLEKKINALKIYDGEMRSFPHPRSPEALKALAMKWGSTSGLAAAEAFEVIRVIRKLNATNG